MSLLHIYVYLLKFVCYQQYLRKFLKKSSIWKSVLFSIIIFFIVLATTSLVVVFVAASFVCRGRSMSLTMEFEPTSHCKLWIHSLFIILVSTVSERKESFFFVRNHLLTLTSLFSFIHSSSSLGLSLLSWHWLLEVAWLGWGTASGWQNKWKRWSYKEIKSATFIHWKPVAIWTSFR